MSRRLSARPSRAELERVKRRSLGQALLEAARLFDEQALAALREETGISWLRRSHTAVLPYIDFEGTRTSRIAERMGISKQAVNQVLDDLVSMGVVERTPDPADGRAKCVRFTPSGEAALLQGLGALGEVERRAARVLGARRVHQLRALLTELSCVLKSRESPPPARRGRSS